MRHASTRTLVTGAGRGGWITLAATACVVAIAACGSSSNPHAARPTGGGVAQGIKFADCMRSHGSVLPRPRRRGRRNSAPPGLIARVGGGRAGLPGAAAGRGGTVTGDRATEGHDASSIAVHARARRQRLPRPGQLASVKPRRLELGIRSPRSGVALVWTSRKRSKQESFGMRRRSRGTFHPGVGVRTAG